MIKVVIFGLNDKIGVVVEIFLENLFYGLFIVNEDKDFVGIIIIYDVLKYEFYKEYFNYKIYWELVQLVCSFLMVFLVVVIVFSGSVNRKFIMEKRSSRNVVLLLMYSFWLAWVKVMLFLIFWCFFSVKFRLLKFVQQVCMLNIVKVINGLRKGINIFNKNSKRVKNNF